MKKEIVLPIKQVNEYINSFEQNLSKTIFKIMHDPRTFESLSDFSESTSNI